MVVEWRSPGCRIRVEQTAHPALGVGHPDGGRQPLAEWSGGGLHPGGVPHLRVPRGERTPLPERLQVAELKAVPGQVQLDVLGEGGVPGGEHEPVPAEPVGILRVVSHHLLVEQVGGWGE